MRNYHVARNFRVKEPGAGAARPAARRLGLRDGTELIAGSSKSINDAGQQQAAPAYSHATTTQNWNQPCAPRPRAGGCDRGVVVCSTRSHATPRSRTRPSRPTTSWPAATLLCRSKCCRSSTCRPPAPAARTPSRISRLSGWSSHSAATRFRTSPARS